MGIDKSRLVGAAIGVGLFFVAAWMLGVQLMSAEAGSEARGEVAIREELFLGEIAGRAIVDRDVDESSPWGPRADAFIAPAVLAWMDQHIRLEAAARSGVEDPAKDFDTLQLRRGSMWRSMLSDGTELYVLEMFGFSIPEYWLFVRDPAADRVSAEPYVIEGRWMNGLQPTHPPRIERVELDGQGHAELVFHGFGHNGTMYNAYQDYYLERLEDLSLQPVLIVDSHLSSPLEDDQGDVYRSLRWVAKNQLTLEVYWQNPLLATRTLIGTATLRRTGMGEAFAISDLVALAPRADWFLKTGDH